MNTSQFLKRAAIGLRSRIKGKVYNDRIFFMHAPKTGGSSIVKILESSMGVRNQLFPGRSVKLDEIASFEAAQYYGLDYLEYRAMILNYFVRSAKAKYIGGHFPFDPAVFSCCADLWSPVTILRDPTSRWWSAYFYNRYKSSLHMSVNQDIDDYLESERAEYEGSTYTSLLNSKLIKSSEATEKDVERAVSNLGHFSVIGTLENLDEFAIDFYRKFNYKMPSIPKSNPTPASRAQRMISQDQKYRDIVERLCAPDMAVYEAALDLIASKRVGEV